MNVGALLLLMTVLAGSSAAFGEALPCPGTSPLSGLVALADTGCTLGDKLFSNFRLDTTGGTRTVDASLIDVLTSTTPQGNEVLTFAGGISATAGTLTAIIGYTVSTLSNAALIEDLTLTVGPVSALDLGHGSSLTVNEYACIGVNIACTANNADFILNAPPGGTHHSVFAPPVSNLSVAKRVDITASALSVVELSSLTNDLSQALPSQVPEPATGAMLVVELAVAAGLGNGRWRGNPIRFASHQRR